MIPEAAVEAAAWAIYASDTPSTTASGLSDLDRYTRNDVLRQARAALEAAIPIMRQAFFLEMNLRAAQDELRTAPIYRLGKIEDKR